MAPANVTFKPSKKTVKKSSIDKEDIRDNQLGDILSDEEETEGDGDSVISAGASTASQVSPGSSGRKRQRVEEEEDEVDYILMKSPASAKKGTKKNRMIMVDEFVCVVNYNPTLKSMKAHALARISKETGDIGFSFGFPDRILPAVVTAFTVMMRRSPEVISILKADPGMVQKLKESFKDLLSSLK